MVNRRASDAAAASAAAPPLPQTPIAPVVKRKRRASCLGEQERRERKRAIDREAQRSLREKTKTHIAELERTIEILRAKDRNGATASLLDEIEGLRAENERLRDVIDSVKSVVGNDFQASSRSHVAACATVNRGGEGDNHSPAATSVGQTSPKPRSVSLTKEMRHSPRVHADQPMPFEPLAAVARPLDLDGMTVTIAADAPVTADNNGSMALDLEPLPQTPEEGEEEEGVEELPWGDALATATWAPMMEEIFGPNWRCPSPTILHIGNPDSPSTASAPGAMCPIWIKSNELFGKVFNYTTARRCSASKSSSSSAHPYLPSSASPGSLAHAETAEAGLLYQGIARGWHVVDGEWQQSPALSILKQIDELLFCHLPNIERLAVAYKSFKLLKYYLHATKTHLNKVPDWLRPSYTQASTAHPIAVDFFAWPTLRSRLLHSHATLCATSALSCCYSRYLRFDWPFAFEDAFFCDDDDALDSGGGGGGGGGDEGKGTGTGTRKRFYPSPLFERYHGDLRYWRVEEVFYESFPEMRGDIEGDRRRSGA